MPDPGFRSSSGGAIPRIEDHAPGEWSEEEDMEISHNHMSIGVRYSGSYSGAGAIPTAPVEQFMKDFVAEWPQHASRAQAWLRSGAKEPLWFFDGTGIAVVS